MRVVDAAARHPDRLEAPFPHRRSGDGSDPGDFLAVSVVPDCAARAETPLLIRDPGSSSTLAVHGFSLPLLREGPQRQRYIN